MPETDKTVVAQPSKAFFIDMITRDLGLTDCILDLIDNAVDHAVARSGADVMKLLTNGGAQRSLEGCSVELTMSDKEFVIRDTCGGISIHAARTSDSDPTIAAIALGTRKIPEPIVSPITTATAAHSPSPRRSPGRSPVFCGDTFINVG